MGKVIAMPLGKHERGIHLNQPETNAVVEDLESRGAVVTAVAEVADEIITYCLLAKWPDGSVWEIREIQSET